MNARIWMDSLSTAGREPAKRDMERDRDMGPRVGDTTVQEYWDGAKWCERLLTWDGEKFTEVK